MFENFPKIKPREVVKGAIISATLLGPMQTTANQMPSVDALEGDENRIELSETQQRYSLAVEIEGLFSTISALNGRTRADKLESDERAEVIAQSDIPVEELEAILGRVKKAFDDLVAINDRLSM